MFGIQFFGFELCYTCGKIRGEKIWGGATIALKKILTYCYF